MDKLFVSVYFSSSSSSFIDDSWSYFLNLSTSWHQRLVKIGIRWFLLKKKKIMKMKMRWIMKRLKVYLCLLCADGPPWVQPWTEKEKDLTIGHQVYCKSLGRRGKVEPHCLLLKRCFDVMGEKDEENILPIATVNELNWRLVGGKGGVHQEVDNGSGQSNNQ